MQPAQPLLGGGSLLKLGRTAAISALVAATAATLISTAGASSKKDAAGTVAVTGRTIVMSYRDGKDVVQERLVYRTITGTFAGPELSVVHNVTHPDGSVTLTAVTSCTCTVDGHTGTVTFGDLGTVNSAGIIFVQRKSIDATGDLEGLRANLEISGPVAAPNQTYNGRYKFGDSDD